MHDSHAADLPWPSRQTALERVVLKESAVQRATRICRRVLQITPPLPAGIYIFTYHGIIDPARMQPWEAAYQKGSVFVANLRRHLLFLRAHMEPVALSDVPRLLQTGTIDRPYFVITFDDGFTNVLTHAAPVVSRAGVRPTLFLNGQFAEGRVYYRVLAAILVKNGLARQLATELRSRDSSVDWSPEPSRLFDQTKYHYRVPDLIESGVETVYTRYVGEPEALSVHLTVAQVRALQSSGWEVGNHTYAHHILRAQTEAQIADAIEQNVAYWEDRQIQLISYLAYPNGSATDVNGALKRYLDLHAALHGCFCNGGVNVRPNRMEWARIPVPNTDTAHFVERICIEAARTMAAVAVIEGRTHVH